MSERADREREVAASEREHAAVCRAIAAFTIEPGERKRLEEQACRRADPFDGLAAAADFGAQRLHDVVNAGDTLTADLQALHFDQ